MSERNRAVMFNSPRDMRVESLDFPKLVMPKWKERTAWSDPENGRHQHLR